MRLENGEIMANKQSGLGRGLENIFLENSIETENTVSTLRISQIEPKPGQPRKSFDAEALSQLADSISAHGILQPILVREITDGHYQIIAGERRWRAAKMAGLNEVPVIKLDSDDKAASEIALIENIQRENLNPYEEAMAYRSLATEFSLTQEQMSLMLGKSRSAIANSMRLLDLQEDVLDMLKQGDISAGHARTLLALKDPDATLFLAKKIREKGLSVRDTEKAVRKLLKASKSNEEDKNDTENLVVDYFADLERKITAHTGRIVKISRKPNKKFIEISFEDNEDLEALLNTICGQDYLE